MAVDAVIFDFGGVFVDSPFTAVQSAAADMGVAPDVMVDTVFGPYDQDTDHPWHQLERGEITLEDATAGIVELAAAEGIVDFQPVEMLMALGGMGVRPEVVDFCRDVRSRGFRTGLLTNNAREFEEFWVPLLPLDELFDDVVDSSAVGLRKPDARIYELSLERLGVAAPSAVFVDDAPGNVVGAQAVGMRAVLIGTEPADVAVALAELESHLS
jgi:epoxide hydrolase-like predicted phosphatase